MGEQIDLKELAQEAVFDAALIEVVIGALETGSRRERQKAAQVISHIASGDIALLKPYIPVLVSSLDRPEAQTRWEVLGVLFKLVDVDSDFCDSALQGAETALFDEESGSVRLAGMKFMCKVGALSEARSEKVWPFIDEAIQCYHGDHEFPDMMNAVVEFSAGNLSGDVKDQLAARMKFDAENGKGTLKRKAALILENASK